MNTPMTGGAGMSPQPGAAAAGASPQLAPAATSGLVVAS